jgi:hypothetical protein
MKHGGCTAQRSEEAPGWVWDPAIGKVIRRLYACSVSSRTRCQR